MVHLKIFSMLPFPGFQANLVTIKIFGSQNFYLVKNWFGVLLVIEVMNNYLVFNRPRS